MIPSPRTRVRVKICGITRLTDALIAVEAGVDALGFVFVPGTPRYIEPAAAAEIIRQLPPFISRTGLFVNASEEVIRDIAIQTGIDTLQLHGEEPPELGKILGGCWKVIQAFRVRAAASLESLPAYRSSSHAWLLDAYVAGVHGGTGAQFDWTLALEAKKLGHPIVLAGGLNPESVERAIQQVHPYALDVSSGVESSPGLKCPQRIRAFLDAVISSGSRQNP